MCSASLAFGILKCLDEPQALKFKKKVAPLSYVMSSQKKNNVLFDVF